MKRLCEVNVETKRSLRGIYRQRATKALRHSIFVAAPLVKDARRLTVKPAPMHTLRAFVPVGYAVS